MVNIPGVESRRYYWRLAKTLLHDSTSAAVPPAPIGPFPLGCPDCSVDSSVQGLRNLEVPTAPAPTVLLPAAGAQSPLDRSSRSQAPLTTFMALSCPPHVPQPPRLWREDEKRGHHRHLSLTLFSSMSLDENLSLANTKTSCTRKMFHPKTFSNDLELWVLESKGPGRAKETPRPTSFQTHRVNKSR